MSLLALITPGRVLITLGNLAYSVGAFAADYNHTHVFNPRWPPHAKFHNGQTMSLGTLLALTSTYFLYRSGTGNSSKGGALEDVFASAWIGSLYCLAGLSAIWYPGTKWTDPEFVKPGQGTQMPLFAAIVGFMWAGYGLERWRLLGA